MTFFPRPFTLPFLKREAVAEDIYSFSFSQSNECGIEFQPGQFVRMVLALDKEDPRSNRRYFTISSSPLDKEKITITTKVTSHPSIFKQKLLSLQQGEDVKFWGPSGSFIMPEDETVPLIFLSGGMGITPFHSMLSYLYEKNISRSITLLASFAKEEEMLFYQKMQTFSDTLSLVTIIYTLTSGEETSQWQGERGRITKEMIQRYVPDLQNNMYYASGPIPFVKTMVETVQSLGVEEEKIKRDNFPGY